MRILVLGSGGREHALVWALRKSARVREVICAPGNCGIARHARCLPVLLQDNNTILDLVRREEIDLVVVGPEAPLASGLVDVMNFEGIPTVGPSRAAAQLESSKVFAKEFMVAQGIPTAPFAVFSDAESALARIDSRETRFPQVVKADGLAAGKGVVVARSAGEARSAIRRMMVEREFGSAGERIVIEDCLEGVEASYIVFTDGQSVVPAVAAQDHKAVYDGDQGPNTGGMGAYSTDAILDAEIEATVLKNIIRPAVNGMHTQGAPFCGILYAGLMLTSSGPKVLEFNVRMGDPEAQVLLPRLDTDFALLCEAICLRKLDSYKVAWKKDAAVCIVAASGGYPGPFEKGKAISGLDLSCDDERVMVFHSGTKREGDRVVTDGGRVLGVTAVAEDLPAAVRAAYEAMSKIHFEGMHFRKDIGYRGLRAFRH